MSQSSCPASYQASPQSPPLKLSNGKVQLSFPKSRPQRCPPKNTVTIGDRVPSRHLAAIAMARQYPPAPSSRVQCIEYTRRAWLSRRVRTHSLITYSLESSNTVLHNVRLLSRYESRKSRDQRNCRRLMLTTWSYYRQKGLR